MKGIGAFIKTIPISSAIFKSLAVKSAMVMASVNMPPTQLGLTVLASAAAGAAAMWAYSKWKEGSSLAMDELTQIPKGAGIKRWVTNRIMKGAREGHIDIVVSMVDLDNFKVINELFDYHQGNVVLKQLVQVIRDNLRVEYGDDIVVRLHGEEFMIGLDFNKARNIQEEERKLQRILQRIRDMVCNDGKDILNNRKEIIARLKKVRDNKTNVATNNIIFEALKFQLVLQNEGAVADEIRKLPDLRAAVHAIEEHRYNFERWIITASMGSVRVAVDLTRPESIEIGKNWKEASSASEAFFKRAFEATNEELHTAKNSGRNRYQLGSLELIAKTQAKSAKDEAAPEDGAMFGSKDSGLPIGVPSETRVPHQFIENIKKIARERKMGRTEDSKSQRFNETLAKLPSIVASSIAGIQNGWITIAQNPRTGSISLQVLNVLMISGLSNVMDLWHGKPMFSSLGLQIIVSIIFKIAVSYIETKDEMEHFDKIYSVRGVIRAYISQMTKEGPEGKSKKEEEVFDRLASCLSFHTIEPRAFTIAVNGDLIVYWKEPVILKAVAPVIYPLPHWIAPLAWRGSGVRQSNKEKIPLGAELVPAGQGAQRFTASATMGEGKGGIDLTPANINVQTQTNSSSGTGINFHIDPAMLTALQNAPGFVPVIVDIQPVTDLSQFLGVPSA
jgi:diguanylate cyclase (GGDEF)-like protein